MVIVVSLLFLNANDSSNLNSDKLTYPHSNCCEISNPTT